MPFLPQTIDKTYVPPLKCQGIKTKLVPFIVRSIEWDGSGKWVEPFLGSGVVAFNVEPQQALLSDVNPHIIALYQDLYDGVITPQDVRDHLEGEGDKLRQTGPDADESYYYEVRDRFNEEGNPLDYLFLSRSCFNGMVRFNQSGGYNVPFCRKPNRFRKAYVTRIVNQVTDLIEIMKDKDWQFEVLDWREALSRGGSDDFVYLDPPYIGRSTGYYNTEWEVVEAEELASRTQELDCGFAMSMWKENQYRSNEHIDNCWDDVLCLTKSHFYHLGSTEDLRNEMEEALLIRPEYVNKELE